MIRYSLHNAEGNRIGEADTAQRIADMATHGTWSYDTNKDTAYPCIVWKREHATLVGTPYKYRFEAMQACKELEEGTI